MSPAMPPLRDLAVGTEITGPARLMTAERIEWYDSAMLSAARARSPSRLQHPHRRGLRALPGLPAIIADGMIMANWVSSS
jgi:hypothetical protein